MKTNIVELIGKGTNEKLNKLFDDDEKKALVLGYTVELDILEIVNSFASPDEDAKNPLKNRDLRDQLERINLVYDTYMKAIENFPDDKSREKWESMITKIDNIIYDQFNLKGLKANKLTIFSWNVNYRNGKTDENVNKILHAASKHTITILQEVNEELFTSLKEKLGVDYQIFTGYDKNQYKANFITMVILKCHAAEFLKVKKIENIGIDYMNRFVKIKFTVNDNDFNLLGLHSSNAYELIQWLDEQQGFVPDIMIGDFNSGNYIKSNEEKEFQLNRTNYQIVSTGYYDAVQGKYTTEYMTQIDHILIKNVAEFWKNFDVKATVDDTVKLSDHYPISCSFYYKGK